ncbi:MAG: hypothetical protein NXI32_22165 [bacterium]|nr:hypothetical protein [bacterium]
MEAKDYTDQELIEMFEERAAIREYDANFSREVAEKIALADMRKMFGKDFQLPQARHVR